MQQKGIYQVTTNPLEIGPLKASLYFTQNFNGELGSEFIADFETEKKAIEICEILNKYLHQSPNEQPVEQKENEAVGFAEWAGWEWRRVEGKSLWENQKTLEVSKTDKLYERYKKETGKKY
jgi:hypothetical protein